MPTVNNSINLSTTGIVAADGVGSFTGRTLTAGSGIAITNPNGVAGNPIISATGGGMMTVDVTGTVQSMAVNTTYIADNSSQAVTFILPATASLGDIIAVLGKQFGWSITLNSGQSIMFGNTTTTVSSGSLSSTEPSDSVAIQCITSGASTLWTVFRSVGNLIVL